jgi:arylsulfatase A-like enzyme
VTNNGPLRGGKGGLFEGGVRVAACAAWPGKIPAGGTVTQPLHVVDVYPTILKLIGTDASKQKLPVDGIDAWAAIATGAKTPPGRPILLNATPVNGAVRVGDWKLIVGVARGLPEDAADGNEADAEPRADAGAGETPAGKGKRAERSPARQAAAAAGTGIPADARVQLFNLANDPGEQKNLAAEHPEKVKELRAAYDRLAAQAIPPKAQPKAADFKSPAVWGER